MNALDVFEEITAVPEETENNGFIVTDMEKADWCIRKIGQAKARISQRQAIMDAHIREAQRRLEEINREDEQVIAYMTVLLMPWSEMEFAEMNRNTKHPKKSIKLPHGTVKTRAGKESTEIIDEEAAKAWARENKPEAIKVEEKLLVSELKDTACPGIRPKTGETKFIIEPDEKLFRMVLK